ncbi:acetyltransferase, partial [Listeria booriae]|nr:acetyltransferase [Listeria booriae]
LWHYPIITLTTPVFEVGQPNIWRAILQVAATFIIAELSFRFVETPIRKNGFITYFKSFKDKNYFVWKNKPVGKWLGIATLATLLALFSLGMTNILPVNSNAEKQPTSVKTSTSDKDKSPPKKETEDKDKDTNKKAETTKPKEKPKTGKSKPVPAAGEITYTQTLTIGDSLMLDIEPYLKEAVPNITTDGLVGRQLRDAITTATGYK